MSRECCVVLANPDDPRAATVTPEERVLVEDVMAVVCVCGHTFGSHKLNPSGGGTCRECECKGGFRRDPRSVIAGGLV